MNAPPVEVTESRVAQVGDITIRRALPVRARRTVGAWCFADHMGPAVVGDGGLGVAPHPHIGLQTVTWLIEGEALHRDSLGTEQVIAAGQLNLMTAGHGVSHSEEGTGYRGSVHGAQLWVAQPSVTRDGPPAFEHHAELPRVELDHGVATVIVGEACGVISPTRRDTDHLGVDLDLRAGTTVIPLQARHEHGVVVLAGTVALDGQVVQVGQLGYLPPGRDEVALVASGPARLLLLGGSPFDEEVVMWWNYVARSREEILAAHEDWLAQTGRFGRVDSTLPPTVVDPPPWARSAP